MSEKDENKGKSKKTTYLIYFFVTLAVLLVIVYGIPYVTGALKLTYTAEYGDVQIDDEAKIYIARDEKVYVADKAGKINKLIKQGQLVKKDTAIVGVEGDGSSGGDANKDSKYKDVLENLGSATVKTSDYHSKAPGVVSYYADGYENKFTEDSIAKLTEADVEDVSNKNISELDRETTMAGEPLFKIVNNAKWFIFTWLPADDAEKYKEGNSVQVKFEDGSIEADVKQVIKQDDDKTLVIFKTNRYYEVYDQKRCSDATIVASNTSGIILEADSIREEDGQKGVYVENTLGDFVFKPINILAEDGDKVIVSKSFYYDAKGKRIETVNTYDQVQR